MLFAIWNMLLLALLSVCIISSPWTRCFPLQNSSYKTSYKIRTDSGKISPLSARYVVACLEQPKAFSYHLPEASGLSGAIKTVIFILLFLLKLFVFRLVLFSLAKKYFLSQLAVVYQRWTTDNGRNR